METVNVKNYKVAVFGGDLVADAQAQAARSASLNSTVAGILEAALALRESDGDILGNIAAVLCRHCGARQALIGSLTNGGDTLTTAVLLRDGVALPAREIVMGAHLADLPVGLGGYFISENPRRDFPALLVEMEIDRATLLGFPLTGSLGVPAGAVFLSGSPRLRNTENAARAIKILAPLITRELERRQAEEFLLATAGEIDILSTSFKEIHRLSITEFNNLPDLYGEYLRTEFQPVAAAATARRA